MIFQIESSLLHHLEWVEGDKPGPHGCAVQDGLLLYHPPRPLGPGVFLRHSSLKHFLSRQAGHHCLSRWVEGRVGNLKAGRSVSWRPSGRVVCAL